MSQDGTSATHSEERLAVRAVVREALDRDADWAALASAGLLALAVPESHGGEGLGLGEVSELLRETGSRGVHLPVWETLCCGALTLAAAGSDAQQERLLPGVATGEVLLTPAVREIGTGIGILTSRAPSPWLWGRVAGDALDIATVGAGLVTRGRPLRTLSSMAMLLGIAYVDSGLVSDVKAGENRGVRLSHDHVVRAFAMGANREADGRLTASATFPRPREGGTQPTVVAFVQRPATGEVLQAVSLPLTDCLPP